MSLGLHAIVYTTIDGGKFHFLGAGGHSTRDKFEEVKSNGYITTRIHGDEVLVTVKYVALLKVEDDFDFVLGRSREAE